jgi:hypothetical protein
MGQAHQGLEIPCMSAPLSLLDALAQIPDPRDPRGRRHPLSAILSLAVLAMLTGCKSYAAIVQFGRDKGFALAHALGFRRGKTPCKSTFSILFRALDITAFENALSRWIATRLPPGAELVINLDGKTLRGSKDGETPGQHLVAAYAPHVQAVLAQLRVDAKTNEHKAALELLGILPVQGHIVTGDAMFCQRDLCARIVEQGGDYLFAVKDNQPSLAGDIQAGLAYEEQTRRLAAAFSPRWFSTATAARTSGEQHEQGPRTAGKADAPHHDHSDEAPRLEGIKTRFRAEARADGERSDYGRGGAWHDQPVAGTCRRQTVAGVDSRTLEY